MSEIQAEEIIEALEPAEECKKKPTKKAAPKASTSTQRARAVVLERLKNR
jgi:hypothetical protein